MKLEGSLFILHEERETSNMDEESLFNELASDAGIQAAIAAHEAACMPKQGECIICRFFTAVHELKHFAEVFDSEKILGLTVDIPEFLSDSMSVIQFLTETCKMFLDNLEFFGVDEEEEEDYEEDEDEE